MLSCRGATGTAHKLSPKAEIVEAATDTRPEPSTTGSICSEFLDRPIDVAVVVNKVQYMYKYPISRLFVSPFCESLSFSPFEVEKRSKHQQKIRLDNHPHAANRHALIG